MSRKKKQSAAKNLIDTLLDDSQSEKDLSVTVITNSGMEPASIPEVTVLDSPQDNEYSDKTVNLGAIGGGGSDDAHFNKTEVLASPELPDFDEATNIANRIQSSKSKEVSKDKNKSGNFLNLFKKEKSVRHSDAVGGLGKPQVPAPNGLKVNLQVEQKLGQAEHLRIAQERILDLEKETERLREENEYLLAAGETMKKRADEMFSRAEKMEVSLKDEVETGRQERQILKEGLASKNEEIINLKQKNAELEIRLESDLKKIRVRERELENRLEIVKMEEAALLRSKDDIILDMKRRVDQLMSETENYKAKSQDLHQQVEGEQDRLRRTVRALRLALSLLEDGDIKESIKKAS